MTINNLPLSLYGELITGFLLWWFAIFLITHNPLDRIIQLSSIIFASFGFYFASDVFFSTAFLLEQYDTLEILLKFSTWSIYFPYVCLFHISYLLLEKRKLFQTILLYLAYFLLFFIVYFETCTNLIRNYPALSSPKFDGDISSISGRYFWIMGLVLFFYIVITMINFMTQLIKNKKYSNDWWKYFWPLLAMVINLVIGPIIILGYYKIVPHSIALPITNLLLTALFFAISVIKYRLYIEEPKIIFSKKIIYTAFATIIIISILFKILTINSLPLNSVYDLIVPLSLIYFITAVLPLYSWLNTFINDLLYNPSLGLSVVSDNEILDALKNFNNPSNLEINPLLRLKVISKEKQAMPVDTLRKILRESIEYFNPNENYRRTKQNLKYQLLKMLAFDQSEEGQILWELGFEDYPVRIMASETKNRPPLFKTKSPSEYSYISRNAFLALKKEAIHDITWRISYLEKLRRK
jgi:hypothetical protein